MSDIGLKLPREQRIFVNRSLNMASIRSIGFDMDHTLVQYNRETFEALAFHETLKKFLDAGYPSELEQVRFDPNFVIRGLLVDRERGNLLKVDQHKYVKVAYHGRRPLEKKERYQLYNAESYKAQNFLSIDTFFALSEVQLFTEIVDYMARHPGKIEKSFGEVYSDLREFIDLSHRDGSIKTRVVSNPEYYLLSDKHLAPMLVRYIEAQKSLFLLTNSLLDYTNVAMSFCLDGANSEFPHWRDYFEHIIVGAGKPGFFNGSQPFYEVVDESGLLRITNGKLRPKTAYQGGNAHLFQKLTGLKGDEILYCGDHIYTDIIRSKELFNWRTLLIVEELYTELPKLEALRGDFERINASIQERELLDEELQRLRTRFQTMSQQATLNRQRGENKKAFYIDKELEKIDERISVMTKDLSKKDVSIRQAIEDRERKLHPIWGELSRCGLEKSRFAKQVDEYACIYTAKVSNLRHYSPFKRFTSSHDQMPHDP